METKKILKWPLIIGIVIVLNMFFLYAVKVAYPEPQYDDFCKKEQIEYDKRSLELINYISINDIRKCINLL